MHEISEPNRPLMTRKELVEHIRGALGIPLKLSTFNKKAMHRETPAPDKYYGRTELYDPKRGEDWAREVLVTDKPTKLGVG